MEVKIAKASTMRKGNYIIIEDEPSVVTDNQSSKTTGRGCIRCKIEAVGMISGKKRIELVSGGDNVKIPVIEKKNAQILSVGNKKVNVMDMENYESFDLDITDDVDGIPTEGGQATYWIIGTHKVLKQAR